MLSRPFKANHAEDHVTSNFRVEEYDKQETGMKQVESSVQA
jgi:hypothetical protein